MKDKPLLPSIILLVCAMLFGFIALAWIADALLVMVLVGLVVVATSVLVLRFAVIFDRQMRLKRGRMRRRSAPSADRHVAQQRPASPSVRHRCKDVKNKAAPVINGQRWPTAPVWFRVVQYEMINLPLGKKKVRTLPNDPSSYPGPKRG